MSHVLLVALSLALLPGLFSCGGADSPKSDSFRSKGERSERRQSKKREKKRAKKKERTPEEYYRKAIDSEADEKFSTAQKYYERAIGLEPAHEQANQRYVHFLIDRGAEKKALKTARRFYSEESGGYISSHTLADAGEANGDYQLVIKVMTKLLDTRDDDAVAYEKRGRAKISLGENKSGIRDIRQAIKKEPENSQFLLSLAGGLLRNRNTKAATKILRRLVTNDKGNAEGQLLLGIAERSAGRIAAAKKWHKAAEKLDPTNARVQYELGITLNLGGVNKQAELHFERAVDLAPDNGNFWYGYAELFRVTGRMDDAAIAYREASRLLPENPRYWERLGEALLQSDQLPEAAKELKRGLSKVENARLYFLLGKVYLTAEKEESASRALEKYIRVSDKRAPDRKEARKLLKRLR